MRLEKHRIMLVEEQEREFFLTYIKKLRFLGEIYVLQKCPKFRLDGYVLPS